MSLVESNLLFDESEIYVMELRRNKFLFDGPTERSVMHSSYERTQLWEEKKMMLISLSTERTDYQK